MKNKKNTIYIILVVLVVVLVGGYFYKKQNKEFKLITDEAEMSVFVKTHTQEELDNYREKVEELKVQDTFGAKTPEETLQLYIDALKKGDLDLASKYFKLEDQKRELSELEKLTKDKLNSYISVISLSEEKQYKTCNEQALWCEIDVDFKGERVLISKFVKIEQSGLWKLKSI